jgi:hypothetical protein
MLVPPDALPCKDVGPYLVRKKLCTYFTVTGVCDPAVAGN